MNLGARVKKRREELQLSQSELAQLIGVWQSTISSLEARDTRKTDHEARLAQALGVTVDWLRTGEAPKYPPSAPRVAEAPGPYDALPHRQRTLIEKLLALSGRTLDHLEPLIDDLQRLQAFEQAERRGHKKPGSE